MPRCLTIQTKSAVESKAALCRICCTAWLLVPVPGVRDSPLASTNEWDLYRRTGRRSWVHCRLGRSIGWSSSSMCLCVCLLWQTLVDGIVWHSPKRLTGHDWLTRNDWQKPGWQPRGGSVAACVNP
ncbi:hypothetical protein CDEST_00866 [Colletotrichum destructivum]|uniref:Uncharacterized protein n=1 Tax=Colletotrichum destructivum TaxID=34406 RepID=A0AAX4HXE2_9PEZI|nr:hypothetical protein CDEST_00866 [Colletotrichum destructivum]